MNIKTILTATALAIAFYVPVVSFAEAAKSDGSEAESHFKKIDTNGDGFIDKNEASSSSRLTRNFDSLDKNKDGKLSKDELPTPPWLRNKNSENPKE